MAGLNLRQFLGLSFLCAVPIAAQTIQLENGVFRVTADGGNIVHGYPLDLAPATSITFTRRNPTTFAVTTGPLAYDDDIGPLVQQFRESDGANWHFRPYQIGFDFPFFDQTLRQVFISAHGAIFTAPPPTPLSYWVQYAPLDVYGRQSGMIAPLLRASGGYGPAVLYIREKSDRAIFTFRSESDFFGTYDIQAVLRNDGTIVFSYRTLDRIDWGVVAVTSGREPWRTSRTLLVSGSDPEGDVSGEVASAVREMIDIVGWEVSRVSDSDVIEIRVRLKQTPAVPPHTPMEFRSVLTPPSGSPTRVEAAFYEAFTLLDQPGQRIRDSLNPRPETGTVVLTFLQSETTLAGPLSFSIQASAEFATDSASGTFVLDSPGSLLVTDLSSLSAATDLSKPIFEVFMRPAINDEAIGERVAEAYGLRERDVDQIALYATFPSEMTFYAAGLGGSGNPATSGIKPYATADDPFRAGVILVNQPLKTPNDTLGGALFLLTHEFGHRWLDHTLIDENGIVSSVLNPDNAHAGAYVHNPAAFPVKSPFEISAMGGGWFEDLGNGSFRVPIYSIGGYSWWELYLMGLAPPDEVQPWFYIANAQPPLTGRSPGVGQTYSGIRKNVRIDQIIAVLGPRIPSFEESQRMFRTLFAIVELPGAPATSEQINAVATYSAEFKKHFAAITGNRARIATGLPESPTADFNVTQSGTQIVFTDTSRGDPAHWVWSFGDGGTSTLPNPTHRYARAGTYQVTMTVRNSRGMSSKAMTAQVTESPRRRIVRR